MDLIQSIRAFSHVGEAGGFAAAARELGLSRAVVHHQVTQLEQHLGAQLLVRSTRQVSSSEVGQSFYNECSGILDALDVAVDRVRDQQADVTGRLRINAPLSFGTRYMGPIVARFMALHPDVQVELSLSDRLIDPLEEGFDATIRVAAEEHFTSLQTVIIGTTRRILCAAPSFIASSQLTTPSDLTRVRCLHYGGQQGGNRWSLEGPKGTQSYRINCTLWSNNGDVLRDAAIAGEGIAVLPDFLIADDIAAGRLEQIFTAYCMSPLAIYLLHPRHQFVPERTRQFIDHVSDALRADDRFN
ncbi:MAG: LysR substrate-binding domain-containing protein [Pseudomonadota bacterium]